MPTSLFENFRWLDPTTWPWFVYLWLAFAAYGLVKPAWQRFQRQRANSWPPVEGFIESTDVKEPKWFLRGNSSTHFAELRYCYSAQGVAYRGKYTRDFPTEDEAWEFVRDLKGKTVTVLSNPDSPSVSTLSEAAIETLLQMRAPDPYPKPPVEIVPIWMKPWMKAFMAASAVGLVLSLWVHIGAVMGRRVAPNVFFFLLHVGIFVVWFPAVFVAYRQVGNTNRMDFWKIVLKGAPDGMRYMVYGFMFYAMINFTSFLSQMPTGNSGGDPPTIVWRGFSGHWMAFYSAALAILYSVENLDRKQEGGTRT